MSEDASRALEAPSAWVRRFSSLVPAGGRVLDLACGRGRHARLFLALGHPVTAVDRDVEGVSDLRARPAAEVIAADLESGAPWPFATRRFSGIVVVNYLHRPLLPLLAESLEDGGVLIYETFAQGQERLGRPRNPDFLLHPGELLTAFAGRLQVVAYEHGELAGPPASVRQRLCAVNTAGPVPLPGP